MLYVRDYLTGQQVMRSSDAPQSPLVSVILPTYARHASGRLKRAVDSVLSQSFTDFELIIVDDGSTDGSNEFIEQGRARDPRIVHVRHELNSGLPALRVNEGIELARGRFLAFQFDDDSWRPGALAALTGAGMRQQEPAVIVGHCHARGRTIQKDYPDRQPDLSSLYATNFIANNSVLIPRTVIERYGMFDCHIAMRRLCDWDMWLRYAKHLSFVLVDDIVSHVELELPDSVGLTTPLDLSLVRFFHSVQRDHLLTPARWREYEVDSLRAGEIEIEGELRLRLYEEQIVGYYLRHRHQFPQIENFPAALSPRRKSVVYTSEAHNDALYEILTNHDEATIRRGTYKTYGQLQHQILPGWERETDTLVLIRSHEKGANDLIEQAMDADVPVGYFLDDDFLTVHEGAPEFKAFAPGKGPGRNLKEILRGVDVVWATSRAIRESVEPLNPRIVPYNGSIVCEALPPAIRPREEGRPLRIGCTSHQYRQEELRYLWPALVQFSDEYREKIVFEFWGVDVSSMTPLASPLIQRPFIKRYPLYLERLREANLDLFLAPLLGQPRARLAKAPNKYYLAAVAGALGIFSDVQPYEMLPGGLTCLKAANSVEGWYNALCEAATMEASHFDLMRQRLLEHVREDFTEPAEINRHEAALRATEFHARTRHRRAEDDRPRILFYCGKSELTGCRESLRERVKLARDYGIEPVVAVACTDALTDCAGSFGIGEEFNGVATYCLSARSSEDLAAELEPILEHHNPSMAHSHGFEPAVAKICRRMNIPHVSTSTDVEAETQWHANFPYSHLLEADSLCVRQELESLGVEKVCARGLVSQKLFDIGARRRLEAIGRSSTSAGLPARIMLIGPFADDSQLTDILKVLSRLCEGQTEPRLDIYLNVIGSCQRLSDGLCLSEKVSLHDHLKDRSAAFSAADILLCLPMSDTFPQEIKEAMASGVLVVTPLTGGVGELIIDQVTGMVCESFSIEHLQFGLRRAIDLSESQRRVIVEQARRVARAEFHPSRAANDLFLMYNRAIDTAGKSNRLIADRPHVSMAESAEIWEEPKLPPRGHVCVSNRIQFSVVPRRQDWFGLDVLVGTHMRTGNGQLNLQVRSASGELLREASQDLFDLEDNDWVYFRFDAISEAAKRTFIAEFGFESRDRSTKISIYEHGPLENRFLRMLRRAGVQTLRPNLYCRMCYRV
jgi:glycosyltransferase involved in cell wall biosynthesis